MKKIIYLSLVLPLILFSCESTPEALFSTNTDEPVVGQEVFFTNDSQNANQFEWDFGDGYISNDANPSHIYTGTGTYEVVLTAISKKDLEDKASLILEVVIPTLLEIEVREYVEEFTVADASVILYSTITDWDVEQNAISEGFTDADGIVVFSNLDPFVYYVDVWEATHDNYTLRSEGPEFIRTPEILPHKINRYIAWVNIADHGKGTGRGTRTFVIRKFERKPADKKQPSTDSGTEGWEELYNRRVIQK